MSAPLRGKGSKSHDCEVTPLVARVLGNENFYGDAPPDWPKARTSKQAREVRKTYIKRLRRFTPQFPEAKALAKFLSRCKPHRRCMSGACPECTRAFQRWFVARVVDLGGKVDPDHLKSISVIFQKHRTAEDQMYTLLTTGMKRSISQIIKQADGIAWIAGGIDLSLNDNTQKRQDVFWQPQLYAIADADRPNLSNLLRKRFNSTEIVHRPVQIKACDGTDAAVSYAYKTEFVRRIAYEAEVGPPDHRRTCWHTRKVSLRPAEHVRAMLWMHEIGLHGRLFLHGVRTTRVGDGVRLAKIKQLK